MNPSDTPELYEPARLVVNENHRRSLYLFPVHRFVMFGSSA